MHEILAILAALVWPLGIATSIVAAVLWVMNSRLLSRGSHIWDDPHWLMVGRLVMIVLLVLYILAILVRLGP